MGLDALHRGVLRCIDRADAAVRYVAPFERDVLHADERDVIDVRTASLNQSWILAALHPLADEFRQERCGRHGSAPRRVRRALNGVDDVLIAGAPAEIAGDAFANLALGRLR